MIAAAIALSLAAAWVVREAVLLFFGAILFAVLYHAAARLVMRLGPIGYGWALAIAAAAAAIFLAGLLAVFGLKLEAQAAELSTQLPAAWARVHEALGRLPGGDAIEAMLGELTATPNLQWLGKVGGYAATFGKGLLDLVLIVVGGVYLAAQPRLYIDGAIRLLPEAWRGAARRVLVDSGALLRRWAVAQLIAMATIGALFGLGLWSLGVPGAAALGVLAGVAEFIPLLGPILVAIPALVLAASGGLPMMVGTLAVYGGIHVFESNLLQPLLQRGMTKIPPVLLLFALVAFFTFFGLLGIVFAAPLTIVLMVVVRDLYLPGDRSPLPSHDARAATGGAEAGGA
ncbi:MAG TPA: AI-2E family transporter [Caulobacteraceae bacterium]|nr:AI-2E family transporter [Caulobacteraceae bacterium]